MVWGPIIGAAIGGAASLFGGASANREAKKAAQRQMDFQYMMANNRYAYAMADMQRSGLNPILAYKQGGGPVPGGSSYTPQNIGAAGVTGAAAGAQSALALRRQDQELKNMKEVIKTERSKQQLNYDAAGKARQDRELSTRTRQKIEQDMRIRTADEVSAKAVERLYRKYPSLRAFEVWRRSIMGGSGIHQLRKK